MIIVLLLLGVAFLLTRYYLRGPDLSHYDSPAGQRMTRRSEPSEGHSAVLQALAELGGPVQGASGKARIVALRETMDRVGLQRPFNATVTPVSVDGVPGEWVVAPQADPSRRVLYIHGGAFIAGSPRSHRPITQRFSEVANAAVLVIDYRLMPEHRRMAGILDCRTAYRFILRQGPDQASEPSAVFVAGDSAGGNLTLSLIAWIRDAGLRAPDAAVAFSPSTDQTLSSPSLQTNLATDAMLGPMFAALARLPKFAVLWYSWLQLRMRPSDPRVSPLYGNLSNLPPVLVQLSEAEMLEDEGRRYVNRARAAGSPATLQSWPHMVHVWQMFYPELVEAEEAWDAVEAFLHSSGPAQ